MNPALWLERPLRHASNEMARGDNLWYAIKRSTTRSACTEGAKTAIVRRYIYPTGKHKTRVCDKGTQI